MLNTSQVVATRSTPIFHTYPTQDAPQRDLLRVEQLHGHAVERDNQRVLRIARLHDALQQPRVLPH